MKKLFILLAIGIGHTALAQTDFKTEVANAKTAYSANKLEDAHFALQQALSEIDIVIGKEVLKIMPEKMDAAAFNPKDDHVTSNLGFVGATIQRTYGAPNKVTVEIISNSPLVATLNTLLNAPLVGGMMRDENSKTIKVQGYKARLERQSTDKENEYNYTVQLPFGNALLTFTVNNSNESETTKLLNTLKLGDIAKLIQ